jgi:1-acyl-sn-glycerol-3-phosphate acyltransferase
MKPWADHPLRVIGRLLWLIRELFLAAIDYARNCAFRSSSLSLSLRAEWLQRSSMRLLKVFNLELEIFGPVPREGLLVCNHLSYLDILVLSALSPSVFVAKSEVKNWPVFGWFARLAGTIFVERQRPSQVLHSSEEIAVVLRKGALVTLFPEGTSSGGENVLPFKSSLLEQATRQLHLLQAGHIRYDLSDGSVSEEVCYWKEMTLLPHLLNLLAKRAVRATVAFSEVHQRSSNRKELARQLHREVLRLRQTITI